MQGQMLLYSVCSPFQYLTRLHHQAQQPTLQHRLGVALEGVKEPGVVRLQEDQGSLPVPQHVGPVGMVALAGIPPLSSEP